MTPEQIAQLLGELAILRVKFEFLVDETVPRMMDNHDKLLAIVIAQGRQISYLQGGIAVVATAIIAFGAAFLSHIYGGK